MFIGYAVYSQYRIQPYTAGAQCPFDDVLLTIEECQNASDYFVSTNAENADVITDMYNPDYIEGCYSLVFVDTHA